MEREGEQSEPPMRLTTLLVAPACTVLFVTAFVAAVAGAAVIEPTSSAGRTESIFESFTSKQFRELPEVIAAQTRYRERDFEGAIKLLAAVRERQPTLPHPRLLLAWMLMSDRQIARARIELERAVVEAPDDAHIYRTFGQIALAEGRVTDAALSFEKATELAAPGGWVGAKEPALGATVLDGLAAIAERRGNWPRAEEALREWLQLAPHDVGARVRLGRALVRLGRTGEALASFEQAFTADPTLDPPQVLMAAFSMERGQAREAGIWLRKAVERHPDNPGVRQSMARWHLAVDEGEKAQREANNAADLGDDSRRLMVLTGLIAHRIGDYEAAEKRFEVLYQASPADIEVSTRLALALIEQDQPRKRERALQLAEVNARQFPRNADIVATLGWVYHRLGRDELAERTLRAALSARRVGADSFYYLAAVLTKKGETEEARRLLDVALQTTDASFSFRSQALTLRDQLG